MFHRKKRRGYQRTFDTFLARRRSLSFELARAITKEHLTCEQPQEVLERIAEVEKRCQAVINLEGEHTMIKGKGICLQERALVQFPDGEIRSAQIWKHTQGVQAIYAIAPDEEGILTPFALAPVWKVQAEEDGTIHWQGMGSGTWLDTLDEWWTRLKLVLTKGRTRPLRKLNLA